MDKYIFLKELVVILENTLVGCELGYKEVAQLGEDHWQSEPMADGVLLWAVSLLMNCDVYAAFVGLVGIMNTACCAI